MRIAIIGAGGVGGYFGARFAASGQDVAFLARGRHLEAMRRDGLKVLSPLGDVSVPSITASDRAADLLADGAFDLVILTTKQYDTDAVLPDCIALAGGVDGAGTAVTFQNGLYGVDRLMAELGPSRVLGGVALISAFIQAPGVIEHANKLQVLQFGPLTSPVDPALAARAAAFQEACDMAGVDGVQPPDMRAALWVKLIMLTAWSAANCLTRLPIGPIRDDPDGRRLLELLVAEATAVGRASGVALPADQEAKTMSVIDSALHQLKASMLVSLERGERMEIDYLSGAIADLGQKLGVDTPTHRVAQLAMAPFRNGPPAGA